MSKVYTIQFDKGILKTLNRLPWQINDRIATAIDALAHNPRPHGCVKLEGAESDYRIRVGVYRIIYTVYDDWLVVLVIDVGPRKDIYRRRRK